MLLCGGVLYFSALLPAQAAQAISLPVEGVYGAGGGCKLVASHGFEAIVAAGGTESFSNEPETDDAIVASPAYVAGPDWICEPGTVDGENAALLCVTEGATWVPMPIATFDPANGSIQFIMEDDAPVTLKRCRD